MALKLNAKAYCCEYADFEVNEDGGVVVTLVGDFPPPEAITQEEAFNIVNDPLFIEMLRQAYHNSLPGTPLRIAFSRIMEFGETAILRFQQQSTFEAAA